MCFKYNNKTKIYDIYIIIIMFDRENNLKRSPIVLDFKQQKNWYGDRIGYV